jgi:hypothetical protein
MCENADQEWYSVADEHIDLRTQPDDKVLALVAKQAECNGLAQNTSDNIQDNAVPSLVDNATTKEMVKLKPEITTKNVLSKLMQAILGAAILASKEIKKPLPTTEDERDMSTEQMESAMMQLNATIYP